jgi:predicted alpha/beta hydrolase family esterase
MTWSRFRVPALLISSEDDLYGTYPSARYTSAHINGARFVGYLTGGHLLLGHWKEASSEVVTFLQGVHLSQEGVWCVAGPVAQIH